MLFLIKFDIEPSEVFNLPKFEPRWYGGQCTTIKKQINT